MTQTGTSSQTIAPNSKFGQLNIPVWVWFFLPFAVVGISIALFVIIQPITVLPRIRLAPGFRLQNSAGAWVSNEDLRGQITLYSFSYLDCRDDCAPSMTQLTAVHDTLTQQTAPINFVTISLNAEKDTPELLGEMTKTSELNGRIPWQWLTGSANQIRAVVGGGFELYFAPQADNSVRFQPKYVLVDRNGMIRAHYFDAQPDSALLQRDINYLKEEEANTDGGNGVAYEAAHLFLCYPR